MDDLEYSVVIAERDWESFYEESEQCSIPEPCLASLEESRLSDTDEENTFIQEPALALPAKPDKPDTEFDAAALTQSDVHDCDPKNTAEPERLSFKMRSSEQSAEISLRDISITCACLTLDNTLHVNDTSFNGQQHTALDIQSFGEYNKSEEKSCQSPEEPITSIPHGQDDRYVGGSEAGTAMKVLECAATPKKEKERWFVTVNDSPVLQRQNSGQKKTRKKKSSTKLEKKSIETRRQCAVSNNSKEVTKEAHLLQDEFTPTTQTCYECIYFNSCFNFFSEADISGSYKNKHAVLSPMKAPEEVFEKLPPKTTYTPKAPSFNSLLILTDAQTDHLLNNRSIANKPKKNTQLTTPHDPVTNYLNRRLILDPSSAATTLIKPQEQRYPMQMQEEIHIFLEETQRQGSHNKGLEADVGPDCPIYALSPCWDEMEKVTINDMLHVKSAHISFLNGSGIMEENDFHHEDGSLLSSKHDSVEEMDSTDYCDYFTHVNKGKPNMSRCENTTLCDYDEEFLQILNRTVNPSPEPQHIKKLKTNCVHGHELDLNKETEFLDIIHLFPVIEKLTLYCTPSPGMNGKLDVIRKTPAQPFGNIAESQSVLTLSEFFTNDIIGDDFLYSLSSSGSFPLTVNLSLGQMSDFFPLTQDKTVPIYCVSRSALGDLAFPVVRELDFNPDLEEDTMTIRDMTCFDSQPETFTSSAGMPNLCFYMSQRGNWSSIFSLSRIRFIGNRSTWFFPKEAKTASYISRVHHIAPLTEPQQRAVYISKKDFISSIKQADMCLLCIAFASWVLKTTNSQSTDMWKTALLANISSIAAIQYLRKYGKGHI